MDRKFNISFVLGSLLCLGFSAVAPSNGFAITKSSDEICKYLRLSTEELKLRNPHDANIRIKKNNELCKQLTNKALEYGKGELKNSVYGAVDDYFETAIESVLGKNVKVKHIEAALKLMDTFMTQPWQSSLEYVSVQSCEAVKICKTLLSVGKYAHGKMASWIKDYGDSIYEGPAYNQVEALVLVALNEGVGEFSGLDSCAQNSKKYTICTQKDDGETYRFNNNELLQFAEDTSDPNGSGRYIPSYLIRHGVDYGDSKALQEKMRNMEERMYRLWTSYYDYDGSPLDCLMLGYQDKCLDELDSNLFRDASKQRVEMPHCSSSKLTADEEKRCIFNAFLYKAISKKPKAALTNFTNHYVRKVKETMDEFSVVVTDTAVKLKNSSGMNNDDVSQEESAGQFNNANEINSNKVDKSNQEDRNSSADGKLGECWDDSGNDSSSSNSAQPECIMDLNDLNAQPSDNGSNSQLEEGKRREYDPWWSIGE